jgi:DnaJ-class molecular chaperone
MNQDMVRCPACLGTGCQLDVSAVRIHALVSVVCTCCRGAGVVTSQRVCSKCGTFRSCCPCWQLSAWEQETYLRLVNKET